MIFFLLTLLTFHQVNAQTPELESPPAEVIPTTTPKESDYEVDYEEEEPPEPVKEKKSKKIKTPKEAVLQGSRAEKKIAPMMKSETKSIYKKNGKPLDVDTD